MEEEIKQYRYYRSKQMKKLYMVFLVCKSSAYEKQKAIIFVDGLTGESYQRSESEFKENFELVDKL